MVRLRLSALLICVSIQKLVGEVFNIVSQQSTARPGCIIELDVITNQVSSCSVVSTLTLDQWWTEIQGLKSSDLVKCLILFLFEFSPSVAPTPSYCMSSKRTSS